MRKTGLIIFLVMAFFAGAVPAQSMRVIFMNAPDSVFPLLTRNNRADCVDFIDAGMRARVTNRFEGTSELLAVSDDYLELRSSENSIVQMRLLPLRGDTVIAVVRSVCAEACDSRIAFYKKDWSPAGVSFTRPPIEDFFVPTDSLDYYLVRCDIYLVSLSLSPDDNSLRAEYTMPRYMTESDSALVAPKLRPIRYRWQGGAFVRER